MGNRRFSLVELMVVIAIIGMISTMVVIAVTGQDDRAKIERAKADFSTFDSAIALFKLNTGTYPRALEDLWIEPPGVKNWGPDPYIHRHPRPGQSGNMTLLSPTGRLLSTANHDMAYSHRSYAMVAR